MAQDIENIFRIWMGDRMAFFSEGSIENMRLAFNAGFEKARQYSILKKLTEEAQDMGFYDERKD